MTNGCAVVLQDVALNSVGNTLKKMFDEDLKNVFFIVW